MGGVGKTALAVHWARQVAGRFPDGQLYVNLRGYDPDGEPLAAEVVTGWFLAALGVPAPAIPADAPARAGLYRSVLASRRVLIVLDNARNAAQVRPLLAGGPGCLAIVTSRSSLAGLAATDAARLVPLGLLDHQEATALLTARLGPDRLAAEPAAADSLISACGRLPLALAIIAARAAESLDLPLSVLAAGLTGESGRLDALHTNDEAASARAVFSWSLRYLSGPAAHMFALLGVHCGPDISTAAAASLAGVSPAEARAALAELASASLIREHQPGRYALHDLLRAYAAEQAMRVCTDAEIRAATGRSLDHYLHTMAGMPSFWVAAFPVAPPRPGVIPEHLADHAELLAWLGAEHPVLRQAVEQAAESGFETEAWQVAVFFAFAAYWQGKWADWDAAAQTALAAATRAGDHTGLGWTHFQLANLHGRLGANSEGLAQARLAVEYLRQAGDLPGLAFAHVCVSEILLAELRQPAYRHGTSSLSPKLRRCASDGLRHAEQAFALLRQLGYYHHHEAEALMYAGAHHAVLGDFKLAIDTCQHALERSRQVGDPTCESEAWLILGFVHGLRGEFRVAINSYQQALQVLPDVGPQSALMPADILTELGDAYEAAGDRQAARQAWRDALQILDDLRHPGAAHIRSEAAIWPTVERDR